MDVPAKLAARVRCSTQAPTARPIVRRPLMAVVALRTKTLRVLAADGELEALRILCDLRQELTRLRVQTVNRLQRLLAELIRDKARRNLAALQAEAILATVRPRDIDGQTRAEAMRCLKRPVSHALYTQLRTDAHAEAVDAGPGGHRRRHIIQRSQPRTRTPALRISHFPDPQPRRYPRPPPRKAPVSRPLDSGALPADRPGVMSSSTWPWPTPIQGDLSFLDTPADVGFTAQHRTTPPRSPPRRPSRSRSRRDGRSRLAASCGAGPTLGLRDELRQMPEGPRTRTE